MEAIAPVAFMTTEELLALPEDGMDRELIRGELREVPMAEHNPRHSRIEGRLAHMLNNWRDQQPEPRGEILDGEAGFRVRRNPDTTVGIDLAYIPADLAARTPEDARWVDGVPVLAVEILSPCDTQQRITDKIREYLDAGVGLVWVIEPVLCTVTVYRPGHEPELFNVTHELSGEPSLPGFRVPVAAVFSR